MQMTENGDRKIASRITVTLYDDGRINVNGPLENRVICLGLLAVATDQVNKYVLPKIETVDPAVIAKFTK